jgi:opacity protein-like surface antigen
MQIIQGFFMKRLIFGGLSVLLLSTVASPAVLAQPNIQPQRSTLNNSQSSDYLIEPFQLTYMAYQGFFEDQGIPSFNGLVDAYLQGDVEARDIVASAVQTDRLPAEALNDDSYINAVDWQLRTLRRQMQG